MKTSIHPNKTEVRETQDGAQDGAQDINQDGAQDIEQEGEQDGEQESEQAGRAMIRPKRGRPPRPDAELDETAAFEAATVANAPCKVRVYRRTPRWCSGSVDVYDCDQNVQFFLDEVRRDHGGEIIELVLVDRVGRIRSRLTQRWPDPPCRDGKVLTAASQHDAPAAPPALAPVADPQMKELIAIVLSAQERQAKLQADQMSARVNWLESQLRTAQAAPPPAMQAPYPPPAPPLQPPQAIDLLSQVSKIISEVDGLKAALGATPSAETDSIGPLLHDLIKSQLQKPQTPPASVSTAQPPSAPRPPLPPDTAPTAISDGDAQGDGMNLIFNTLKSRLATMPPAKLESILALVLDETATLEDAPEAKPQDDNYSWLNDEKF